jgi:hypothetical protein
MVMMMWICVDSRKRLLVWVWGCQGWARDGNGEMKEYKGNAHCWLNQGNRFHQRGSDFCPIGRRYVHSRS